MNFIKRYTVSSVTSVTPTNIYQMTNFGKILRKEKVVRIKLDDGTRFDIARQSKKMVISMSVGSDIVLIELPHGNVQIEVIGKNGTLAAALMRAKDIEWANHPLQSSASNRGGTIPSSGRNAA